MILVKPLSLAIIGADYPNKRGPGQRYSESGVFGSDWVVSCNSHRAKGRSLNSTPGCEIACPSDC